MPRTGCQTCKIRRIKCDETKPICNRCAKSRRTCVNKDLVKPVCISFHLENAFASGGTKRPRGPRPRSSLSVLHPTLDFHSQAVTYYLNHYIDHSEDLPTFSACMSECVTEWKVSRRASQVVDLAISAIALAIFSRTQQHSFAAREAVQRYSRLLSVARENITQTAILKCDGQRFDEFLLTIVLMAWYETVMHQCVNAKSIAVLGSMHSWSHHDGALAILKVWDSQAKDCAPSSIVKQTRRGLLRSAILRNFQLPKWVRNGNQFGECGLDLNFDGILVRVVDLKHASKALGPDSHAAAEKISVEARALDKTCREWAENIPSEWSYASHKIPESWLGSDFQTSKVYLCSRHSYSAIWAQYFAVRMLINSTYLALLGWRGSCTQVNDSKNQQELSKCQIQLSTLAEDFASNIPYCLGRIMQDVDLVALNVIEEIPPSLALPVVWPLSVTSSMDGIQPDQQLWFRAQLARLGRVLGDGALQCAGTDLWTHS